MHYKAVLQRDELNVEAHNNLGLLYLNKGLVEDAVREFQSVTGIAPNYLNAHVNLAAALPRLGRVDAGAAEARAALKIDPRSVDAMVNLALAQKAAGQAADARASLIEALRIDSHSAPAHYNLAVQYEEAGEAALAVEHFGKFLAYAGPEYSSYAPDVRTRMQALQSRIIRGSHPQMDHD